MLESESCSPTGTSRTRPNPTSPATLGCRPRAPTIGVLVGGSSTEVVLGLVGVDRLGIHRIRLSPLKRWPAGLVPTALAAGCRGAGVRGGRRSGFSGLFSVPTQPLPLLP